MLLVRFIPVAEEHRDMLRTWLSTPHAQAWWGDAEEELRMIYTNEEGEHEAFIAEVKGEPMAYVQAWRPTQHPDYPWQHGMDKTTRGIDIIIGPEDALGKGHGTLIVKAFAARLFAEGATRLVIDPDKTNGRAVACFLKAGFTPFDEYLETDGSTTVLMELLPEDLVWLADRA